MSPSPKSANPPSLPPFGDIEIETLEALLDAVPAPLEPLDLAMLDGYLVGVLLQPRPVPEAQWAPHVFDAEEGRAPQPGFDTEPVMKLARRRHAQLDRAIAQRQWFDPLVFELDEDATPSEVLLPWVAGFALAVELFPALLRLDEQRLLEPLAALYMHLDPADLEDADELLEEIETLEPPTDLGDAVEGLVSACLMLADIGRPQPAPSKPGQRRGPPGPSGKQTRRVQPKPRRH
ncbi:MAG: YecA family protein [Pelomonas sp.]|nr:YecA family protein [Roseateles sp.]